MTNSQRATPDLPLQNQRGKVGINSQSNSLNRVPKYLPKYSKTGREAQPGFFPPKATLQAQILTNGQIKNELFDDDTKSRIEELSQYPIEQQKILISQVNNFNTLPAQPFYPPTFDQDEQQWPPLQLPIQEKYFQSLDPQQRQKFTKQNDQFEKASDLSDKNLGKQVRGNYQSTRPPNNFQSHRNEQQKELLNQYYQKKFMNESRQTINEYKHEPSSYQMPLQITHQNKFLENDTQLLNLENFQDDESSASVKLKRYIESQIGQNEFGQIQNELNPSFKMMTIQSNTNSPSKSFSGEKSDLDRFIDFYKRFQKSEISQDTPEVFLDKNLTKQIDDVNIVQSLSPLKNVKSQIRNNQDQQMFIDLDAQKYKDKQSNTLQEQKKYEIFKGSQSAQVQKQLPNLPLAQSYSITQSFGATQANPQFHQKQTEFMNQQENDLKLNLQPLAQNLVNPLINSDFSNKNKESPVDSDTHMQEILNELRKDVLELKQQRGYPVSISPPADQRNVNISQINQKQKKIDYKQEQKQADQKNEMRVRQKNQQSDTDKNQKRSKSQGKKLIQNFMNEEIKNLKQEPTIQISPDQFKRRKVDQEYADNQINNQINEDFQRPSLVSKPSLHIMTNKNSALNRSIDSQSSNQHIFQFSPLSSKKQPGEEDSVCENEDQELVNQTSLRSITRNTNNIINNFQSQQNQQIFLIENDNKVIENQQDLVINEIQIEENKQQICDDKSNHSDDDYNSEFELENQKVQVSFKQTNKINEEEIQPDFSDIRHLLNHSTLIPPKTQMQIKQNQISPEVLQKSPKFQYQSFIPTREQQNSALTVQYQTDKMLINSNEYAYRCLSLLLNQFNKRNWNQSKYLAQTITFFLGRPVNKKIVQDKPQITTSIVQTIQQKKILEKLKAIESLQIQKKQIITHDQNQQTDFDRAQFVENYTQTSEPTRVQMSPFDTYDFLFIKELVNNLNYDNEVLFDNANDLKTAFMFLLQEHKKLQFNYDKEKRNQALLRIYRERITQLEDERGQALQLAMKVKEKYEMLSDVMKLAVQDNIVQSAANERLIEQLAHENKELRNLMNIHRDNQAAELIMEGVADLDELEQEIRQREIENNQDGKDQSQIDIEINAGLIAYEQDVLRMQEDYLTIIREEQDLQFNADIDEHKQILKGIYDDKLNQKTEEIIMELNKSLSNEIEQKLRKEFEQEYRQKIMNEIRQEIRQEVKEEVRAEVTNEIRKQVTDNLTKELTNKFDNSNDLFKLQTQGIKNADPYSSTFSQTTKQIEPNNSLAIPRTGNNRSAMFSEDSSSQPNKGSLDERNSEGSVSGADFFDNQILSPEEQALLDQLQQREQVAQPGISEQDNPFLQYQKDEKDQVSDGSDDEQNEANQEKNEGEEEEINEEFLQSFDQFDDDDNNQFDNNQADNHFQFVDPKQSQKDKNSMIPPVNSQNFLTNLSPINKNVNMIEFRDEDLDGDFLEFVQGMKKTNISEDTRNHSNSYNIKNNLQILKNDQLDNEDSASHGTPPDKMLDKDDLFLGRDNEVHFFLDEDEDIKDLITESNLDQTDGLRQIIKQIKKSNDEDDDLERDMDKEDEYDYFLDSHQDENMKENKGYHIIDEEDLSKNKEEDDSDHMEDEEMKQYYKTNMLEGFKEKLEMEDNNNK